MLEIPRVDSHDLREVALGLYERLFETRILGPPSSLLQERLDLPVVALVVVEDRQVVEGEHFEPRFPQLPPKSQ